MKLSPKAKEFLSKTKGDKKTRNLLMKGGRKNAEKDFNSLLKKASKPVPSSQ